MELSLAAISANKSLINKWQSTMYKIKVFNPPPSNISLIIPRQFLSVTCCFVFVYMVSSGMVSCITAVHYASCLVRFLFVI